MGRSPDTLLLNDHRRIWRVVDVIRLGRTGNLRTELPAIYTAISELVLAKPGYTKPLPKTLHRRSYCTKKPREMHAKHFLGLGMPSSPKGRNVY